MRGASGATLRARGGIVHKTCADSEYQARWLDAARDTLIPGISVPKAWDVVEDSYKMDYIEGFPLTSELNVAPLRTLIRQVQNWSRLDPLYDTTWVEYLNRLSDHVSASGGSSAMIEAMRMITASPVPPRSFSHGDLTLENVMITWGGELVLIDPNCKPGVYESYVLDYGKLLQSVYANYHSLFDSSDYEVNFTEHSKVLVDYLREEGLFIDSLTACLTHIMRLRKYRHPRQHIVVDRLIYSIMQDIENELLI